MILTDNSFQIFKLKSKEYKVNPRIRLVKLKKSASSHSERVCLSECAGTLATFRKIQNRLMDTKNIRFGDSDDCAVARTPKAIHPADGYADPQVLQRHDGYSYSLSSVVH